MSTIEHTLDFDPLKTPTRPASTSVLFAEPTHFDVQYVINPHMAGNIGGVDRDLAQRQWEELVGVYRQLGFTIEILPAEPGLPDLCFVANQSMPVHYSDGTRAVILSNMHAPQRRPEVAVVARWFESKGWPLLRIPDEEAHFEGMGDANWHPGHRVVYGGYGWRTQHTAYIKRRDFVKAPVVALELSDVRFYHLDTCFSPLDAHTALIVREAFMPNGLSLLEQCFERLIDCPIDEAADFLAANGHCPDGKHFIVDRGAQRTAALVREAGFEVIEVDTSEFRKSGGSVQCLKLMLD